MEVKATNTGYYGGEIRLAGDVFTITDEKHLSKLWMEPTGPKKAEKPADEPADKDALLAEAATLGVEVDARWGVKKIAEAIAAKKAETAN